MNFIPSRHRRSGALTEVQREHYEIAQSFAGAFEANEFRERYLEKYPDRAPGSILPSDFAYNNEQVAKERFPWFLERVERGVYRFVGMIQQEPADTLYEACRRLEFPELDRAFFYKSIPLAVCDAVFSIGTRYEAVTRPIVARYAQFLGSPLYRDNPGPVISPRKALEMSRDYTLGDLAEKVLKNRQRTSTRNGILKAEALLQWLRILSKYKVEAFADLQSASGWLDEVRNIPGQKNAAVPYFQMLAGDSQKIKPDRHLIRFCERHGGHVDDLIAIAKRLGREPRHLDYAIWLHESTRTAGE